MDRTVALVIDPTTGVPVVRQVVDLLRQRVQSGEWPAGTRLPSETDLAHEYAVGRNTLRDALAVLRGEGVIHGGGRGQRAMVPPKVQLRSVLIRPGETLMARMPTVAERAQFRIPEGVPLLIVRTHAGETAYPADQFQFRSPWPPNNTESQSFRAVDT
jgi:GntR family transcriptional regulator